MEPDELPEPQREAMERWIEQRGFWSEVFSELLFVYPEYVANYADLSARPGEVLESKTKELLHIAINASSTHLYHRGTRTHIRNAFEKDATVAEIAEVLILASTLGIHTSAMGALILDETEADETDDDKLDEDSKQSLASQLGFWSPELDALAERDRQHVSNYADLLSVARESGNLMSKVQDFVLLAVEAAPTRHNLDAARHHAKNAIDNGASPNEVLAVVETASVIGVHTMDAMPILIEEAARRGELPQNLAAHDEFVTFRDPYR